MKTLEQRKQNLINSLSVEELETKIYRLNIFNIETQQGIGNVFEYSKEEIENNIQEIRNSNRWKNILGYELGEKVVIHIDELTERDYIDGWYTTLRDFRKSLMDNNIKVHDWEN